MGRSTLVLAGAIVLALGCAGGYLALVRNPSRVYRDTAQSTAAILVGAPGDSARAATGFYVTPHLLLTCAHVVDRAPDCRVLSNFSDSTDYQIGRVLHADTLRDVAIVYTDSASATPPLEFAEAEVGAPVFAIGNPYGYLASFSSGVVSQLRKDTERLRGLVQCTSPTGHGASGGPLLDRVGRVVAMTSFGDGDDAYLYTFGIDSGTLRDVMLRFAAMSAGGNDGPRLLPSSADTIAWSEISLSAADREMLWGIEGSPVTRFLDEITPTLLAGAPIAGCLLALGVVLWTRNRRLRRQALETVSRREIDALRAAAFLPEALVEFECRRS